MNNLFVKLANYFTSSAPAPKITKANAQNPVDLANYGYDYTVGDTDITLRRLGETRKYLDDIRTDSEIEANWDNRQDFVVSTPVLFESASKRLQKFVEGELKARSFEIMTALHDAVAKGSAVIGLTYKVNDDGSIGIKDAVLMPLEYFSVRRSGQWQGLINGVETDLDDMRFVVATRKPDYDNPMGKGVLSACVVPAKLKKDVRRFYASWLESKAFPLTVGKVMEDALIQLPDGTEKLRSQLMSEALAAFYLSKSIVIDSGDDVSKIETSGDGQAFILFIENLCNNAIQKVILGSGGTIQTENNNRASGQTGENTLSQKINADIRLVINGFQKIVDNLVKANQLWGTANFGSYGCTVAIETNEDLQVERVARDKILFDSGAKFSSEYFADTYGIDVKYFEQSQPIAATDNQQEVKLSGDDEYFDALDKLVESAINQSGQPISPELIQLAVEKSDTKEQLIENLLSLTEKSNPEFLETLENSLFAANLMGYAHADELKS